MSKFFKWSSSEDNFKQGDLSWSLLVSNLHPLVHEGVLHKIFSPFGPICSLRVFKSVNNIHCGYAFVTFEHLNDARDALEALDCLELMDRQQMRVSWADHLSFTILARRADVADLCEVLSYFGQFPPRRVQENGSFGSDDPEESDPRAPKSLIASNLLLGVSERELLEAFSPFGPISSVHVCRNELTRVSCGYGFITFKHRRDAERALEALNFSELFGKTMCISFVQDATVEAVMRSSSPQAEVTDENRPEPVEQSLGRKLVNSAKKALIGVLKKPETWFCVAFVAVVCLTEEK
ncbi:polyadenylate-binding protein 1-like [Puntigrus tetrazona]|uniref:polyadenylate-binding protein 1-like n=1 Tax=Puntigrus tetrazona TaxID=1606681 RepID=UPI001C8A563B|nr:polyadenylate-binding protein 1-like [Puntigrus tetrazona]